MFFRGKARNRRFEREHVLEVKMHSKQVRAARLQTFGSALAWTTGTLMTILLIWRGAEWGLDEFVYRNPTFEIREIEVQTDGMIPREHLRDWTGAKIGDNLFATDLRRIQRDLKLNSLIQDVAVERVLPDRLWVRVTEREPIAQFTAWQPPNAMHSWRPVTYYLDEEGYLLMPSDLPKLSAQMAEHFDDLPKLLGVEMRELTKGRPVPSPRIQAALRLIVRFHHSAMATVADLQEIDLSARQVLEATTRQGAKVTFALDGLDTQLQRWRTVQDYALGSGRAVWMLDLSVSNNVPARWQEAGWVPPVQPGLAKPLRYKKKHV